MLQYLAVFAAVFVAEIGDKTQLATVLFAADKTHHPGWVFAASAGALVLSSALAVLLGSMATKYLDMLPLKLIAGLGFIAIGAWSVFEHFRSA